jgi:hypothetical protein
VANPLAFHDLDRHILDKLAGGSGHYNVALYRHLIPPVEFLHSILSRINTFDKILALNPRQKRDPPGGQKGHILHDRLSSSRNTILPELAPSKPVAEVSQGRSLHLSG